MHGIEKSQAKEKNRVALTLLLSEIQIIPLDDSAAQVYGVIKADLQREGTPIGLLNTLTNTHAKALDYTYYFVNTEEFERLYGKLEVNFYNTFSI